MHWKISFSSLMKLGLFPYMCVIKRLNFRWDLCLHPLYGIGNYLIQSNELKCKSVCSCRWARLSNQHTSEIIVLSTYNNNSITQTKLKLVMKYRLTIYNLNISYKAPATINIKSSLMSSTFCDHFVDWNMVACNNCLHLAFQLPHQIFPVLFTLSELLELSKSICGTKA